MAACHEGNRRRVPARGWGADRFVLGENSPLLRPGPVHASATEFAPAQGDENANSNSLTLEDDEKLGGVRLQWICRHRKRVAFPAGAAYC